MRFISKLLAKTYQKLYSYGTNPKILKWAIKSPRRASLYYFLFSPSFDQEHHYVLKGRYAFYNEQHSMGNEATLRRNLHRIEKGLSVSEENKKKLFAEDFINETVNCLHRYMTSCKDGSQTCNSSFQKWAYDVLNSYFTAVSHTEKVKKALTRFQAIVADFPVEPLNGIAFSIPYEFSNLHTSPINYDELCALLTKRHSVRWYEKKHVSPDLIGMAVQAALTAPSACNRQPFRVLVVQDPEYLAKVRKLPLGFDTFAGNINTFLLIVGNLSAYFDERDKHLIYVDGSLFAMTLMLALETLGLSSCPINYADSPKLDAQVAQIFNLKSYERGVLSLSIGYPLPEGKVPFSQKKHSNELVTIY